MRLTRQALFLGAVLMLAACSTLRPVNVAGVDRAIGDELPGAKGDTQEDQDRIDDTVARACAAGIYSTELCDLHTIASAERRTELTKIGGAGV